MAQRMVPEGGWSNLKPFRTPRVKNDKHRGFIKTLPCICCWIERGAEIQADDPMHIRNGSDLHGKEPEGGGRTADDRWTLPGCRQHHDRQHDAGDELAFWRDMGIDPFLLALVLWGLTGNHWAAVQAMREHVGAAGWRRSVESARRAGEA